VKNGVKKTQAAAYNGAGTINVQSPKGIRSTREIITPRKVVFFAVRSLPYIFLEIFFTYLEN
jgi:hypothetical protein